MKPVQIEVSNPEVFQGTITVSTGDGTITLTCDSVSGSSSVTATLIESIGAGQGIPGTITSTEFNTLASRIGTLSNLTTTDKSSAVAAVNEVNSKLTNFVKWKEITETTTSSGAVQIPTNLGANRILSAHYTDGKTGIIYKRDQSYFTCVDGSFSPYASTSVKFVIIYLNDVPALGT
jgi:hypothetical protein